MTIDDGSCFYALCLPVELTIEENCIWDSFSGEFITRVIITPTITGVCYLEEICYQEVGGGIQGCVDLPATGQFIQSGESVIIPLLGAGVYEFTASTSQGTSDPVDVAVNCYDNQSVCGNPYAVIAQAYNTILVCSYGLETDFMRKELGPPFGTDNP